MVNNNIIEISELLIQNEKQVIINNLSLTVERGEKIALVGPSGCGKTTLSLALLGFVTPGLNLVQGGVKVFGQQILAANQKINHRQKRLLRQRIGRLDQDPALSLTPTKPIGMLLHELAVGKREEQEQSLRRAFEWLQLPLDKTFLKRYPNELSGGQRRRVALAMILLRKPELILLDEPTAGLDDRTRDMTLVLLNELVDRLQATLIVITHCPEAARQLSNKILRLEKGSIMSRDKMERRQEDEPVVSVNKTGAITKSMPRNYDNCNYILHVNELSAGAPNLRRPVVEQLSFDLCPGERMAITGMSGAGKSTVARTLAGLWPRLGGDVFLEKEKMAPSLHQWPQSMRGTIGFVPQDPATSFNPVITLGTSMGRVLKRRSHTGVAGKNLKKQTCDELKRLIQIMDLPADWEGRLPNHFSGGQLQRLAIIRSLIGGAKCLILDEITSGLDEATRIACWNF